METISSKGRGARKNYVAFFDLDGTIISANSGRTLILYAYKKGFITRKVILKGIYLSLLYRLELRDTIKIINSMIEWLKGVSEPGLAALTEETFNNHLQKTIRPEIVEEIRFHKKEGGVVVILSSALMPVCTLVARYLDMDDVICSTLETSNGKFTGNPVGSLCFGEEKITRLKEFCINNNTDPLLSWYYGDSAADLPVLTFVGNPVCVNPDTKLLKVAKKRGWKVIPSYINQLKKAGYIN